MRPTDPRVLPSIDLTGIQQWFRLAVPEPTDKNRAVQLGVHFEEVAEMGEAIADDSVRDALHDAAIFYKQSPKGVSCDELRINRNDLLDALCDQIVTAVGVAHMFGLDIGRAINEVNRSNWSKFDEHGNPIFAGNGKIAKGPNYTPPDLSRFL